MPMPLFMVERNYADKLDVNEANADRVNLINDSEGVHWLYSFLSADLRKTYCLYDAPSAEAIIRAAGRAGLPADVVVETVLSCVSRRLRAVLGTRLRQNAPDVVGRRVLGDEEPRADLPIPQARTDQPEDLHLPVRQTGGPGATVLVAEGTQHAPQPQRFRDRADSADEIPYVRLAASRLPVMRDGRRQGLCHVYGGTDTGVHLQGRGERCDRITLLQK
jgi:hypothetical protein